MKCHRLFFGKNKKNIINLTSAKLAHVKSSLCRYHEVLNLILPISIAIQYHHTKYDISIFAPARI